MIHIPVQQGSEEWLQLRLGIPTASCFDRILTPKELKASTAAEKYRNELLAEWLTGAPLDSFSNGWMAQGTQLEPRARHLYEMMREVEVAPAGFCMRDDRKAGASPDALVGADGGLEIKCPAVQTHVSYMLDPQKLVAEYHGQVQGNIHIAEREWWDVMSYYRTLPPVIVRVEPDKSYQKAIRAVLPAFIENLDEAKRTLMAKMPPDHRVVLEAA